MFLHSYHFGLDPSSLSESRVSHLFKPTPKTQKQVENLLFSLGRMIAVDTCFNNTERLPTIWQEGGSTSTFRFMAQPKEGFFLPDPSNVEFESTGVTAVDSKFVVPASKDEFMKKLDAFLSLVIVELLGYQKNPKKPEQPKVLQDVVPFIAGFARYKLPLAS